jgi:hypothetical protein
MTVFSQPSSFPQSLDERTPFPFRWCLVIRHLRHYGRERRACLATDSPLRSFSFCFRQPYPALGGGWCPGWLQATPKGPQGLDTRRSQRTLSRLEAKTPHWQTTPAPSRHPPPSAAASPIPLLSTPSRPPAPAQPPTGPAGEPHMSVHSGVLAGEIEDMHGQRPRKPATSTFTRLRKFRPRAARAFRATPESGRALTHSSPPPSAQYPTRSGTTTSVSSWPGLTRVRSPAFSGVVVRAEEHGTVQPTTPA